MPIQAPIFAQIMDFVPWRRFQTIIDKLNGDKNATLLKTNNLFKVMAFAQLTRQKSLRDTVFALDNMKHKLYHMGIKPVSRNNLAHALQKRDWRIFAEPDIS